jgi:hypothetical protein
MIQDADAWRQKTFDPREEPYTISFPGKRLAGLHALQSYTLFDADKTFLGQKLHGVAWTWPSILAVAHLGLMPVGRSWTCGTSTRLAIRFATWASHSRSRRRPCWTATTMTWTLGTVWLQAHTPPWAIRWMWVDWWRVDEEDLLSRFGMGV